MKQISILVLDEQANLSTVACIVGAYEIFTEANDYWKSLQKKAKFKVELLSVSKNKMSDN